MKRWLVALGLLALVLPLPSSLAAQQGNASVSANKKKPQPQTYLAARYSNNAGPGSTINQFLRLINVGQHGTPVTSPVGDICANLYVFDNNQVMIACCSCRITPNGLASASIGDQLTNHPLSAFIPAAGTISIAPIVAAANAACSPTAPFASSDASLIRAYGTHLEVSASATYVTEAEIPGSTLGPDEAAFLSNACLFVQYLGSGRGTCACSSRPGG
jgi:hypothetical protein